jgi:hypothetical protein
MVPLAFRGWTFRSVSFPSAIEDCWLLLRWPRSAQDRLDIHDWRSVDSFDRPHSQTILRDLPHCDLMKPNRVGPVWRPRGKHAGQSPLRIGPGMNLENVTVRAMEPSQDDDLVTRRQTIQRLRHSGTNINPGVRSALRTLLRCLAPFLKNGADHTDRFQPKAIVSSGLPSPLPLCALIAHPRTSLCKLTLLSLRFCPRDPLCPPW